MKSDFILAGTFLDPRFGLDSMDEQMKIRCKSRMKALVKLEITRTPATKKASTETSSEPTNKATRAVAQMKQNFIFNQETPVEENQKDSIDDMINDYVRKASACRESLQCPLEFWKINEFIYPELSVLARKFLSIQASSAACERMFSIAGHIYSLKRRLLGYSHFCDLVFLKLNEIFM